jgi:hypothetical protein
MVVVVHLSPMLFAVLLLLLPASYAMPGGVEGILRVREQS